MGSTQNYPLQFSACNTKIELLSRRFIEKGSKVTVINSPFGVKNCQKYMNSKNEYGINFNNFKYCNYNVIGLFKNFLIINKILRKNKSKNLKNIVFYDYEYFPVYLISLLLIKLNGYFNISIYHECQIHIRNNNKFKFIFGYLYDNIFGYFSDAILPISSALQNRSAKFRRPTFKLPIVSVFATRNNNCNDVKNYYAYVVNAGYYRAIDLVINSFKSYYFKNGKSLLKLILHGNKESKNRIYQLLIKNNLSEKIQILEKLSDKKLKNLLSKSKANLIPLFEDNPQDRSRFSQKIAEYLSVKRPIITNFVGEINFYFKDNINAVILKDNKITTFSNRLLELDKKDSLDKIGMNGYLLGRKFFCYKKNTDKLIYFLDIITSKKL